MIHRSNFFDASEEFDDRLVRAHHPCRTPRMMASPHAFDYLNCQAAQLAFCIA
jgi:hypothetical protein